MNSPAQYYRINWKSMGPYGVVKSPHDSSGRYYPDGHGVICDVGQVFCKWDQPASRQSDCISSFEHLIVSSSASTLMQEFIYEQESVRFVPLEINDSRNTKKRGYVCVFFPIFHQVVDLKLSTYSVFPDGTPMRFDQTVLADELPPFDIFGGWHVGWICTARLRSAILKAKLVNFDFSLLG